MKKDGCIEPINEEPQYNEHIEALAAIDQEGGLNPEDNDLAADNPIASVDEL